MTAGKERRGSQSTQLVAGIHSVRNSLMQGTLSVVELWVEAHRRDQRIGEIIALAEKSGIPVNQADREQLDRLLPGINHQGVAARTAVPSVLGESALENLLTNLDATPFLLDLDGVQDPHNLGACLRSADGAGVQAVIAPKDRSAGLTPVVSKVASGAAESVPFFQVTNLTRTLKQLQRDHGIWLVGTAGESERILYQADLRGPLALVMGGEGKGLRRLTREACDYLVRLPMHGAVESLNVSVATGICLYEAVRQRSAVKSLEIMDHPS